MPQMQQQQYQMPQMQQHYQGMPQMQQQFPNVPQQMSSHFNMQQTQQTYPNSNAPSQFYNNAPQSFNPQFGQFQQNDFSPERQKSWLEEDGDSGTDEEGFATPKQKSLEGSEQQEPTLQFNNSGSKQPVSYQKSEIPMNTPQVAATHSEASISDQNATRPTSEITTFIRKLKPGLFDAPNNEPPQNTPIDYKAKFDAAADAIRAEFQAFINCMMEIEKNLRN